ncbi:unnamed protein product [Notodromas monacha]|uniref:Protein-serine/threonine kinase n=1 Tax=Notodromas monacha TaxID=399045 RepID=A0A7R9BRT3_9CRUS|nr:unnamed protein product [Notodromas monacha]CAG0919129.1 unnamed protein product [Notodromas monacha]
MERREENRKSDEELLFMAYHHSQDLVRVFLDRTLTSRLGIRMLAMHHLALRDEKRVQDHIGIINTAMRPQSLIVKWCEFVQRMCQHKYTKKPTFKIVGNVNAVFPYIPIPLDYILPELLKNAARATIENNPGSCDEDIPPILITLANNNLDFIIRISDLGGGIPHELQDKVMMYNFSTAHDEDPDADKPLFQTMMDSVNPGMTRGPMHGFGFGLPTSRAYAEYLGGSLSVVSMQGHGTDVYLRLGHINGKLATFRI